MSFIQNIVSLTCVVKPTHWPAGTSLQFFLFVRQKYINGEITWIVEESASGHEKEFKALVDNVIGE